MSLPSAKPNYSKILRSLHNITAKVNRNSKYGPKFRQPRALNVSYKAPSGAYNIFPEFSDPIAYNSNASYASNPRKLNLFTGINTEAVRSNVPKYIKKGPRTILNPNWVDPNPVPKGPQNLMGRQGPIMQWNKFGPRTRRGRRR